jgi:hypothetical protein
MTNEQHAEKLEQVADYECECDFQKALRAGAAALRAVEGAKAEGAAEEIDRWAERWWNDHSEITSADFRERARELRATAAPTRLDRAESTSCDVSPKTTSERLEVAKAALRPFADSYQVHLLSINQLVSNAAAALAELEKTDA